jgi:ABC-type phosphate transport system substrate-binding protein
LQNIFTGEVTNWDQISSSLPNLPITVVGRDSQSGTRTVFVDTVLDGTNEHDRTSQNCSALDPGQPQSAPMLCEMPNTDLVLQKVNSIPGAIGYAEVAASDTDQNIYRIQIQNHDPDILQNKQAAYPFWATEHVYTYGPPAEGSLSAAFLAFMNSKAEHDAMQKHGATPCANLGQNTGQVVCSS